MKVGKRLFSYMFNRPKFVSVCRSGKIFVLDELTSKCLSDNGEIYYQFRELALKTPMGLYADDDGDLIVCDRHSNTIKLL